MNAASLTSCGQLRQWSLVRCIAVHCISNTLIHKCLFPAASTFSSTASFCILFHVLAYHMKHLVLVPMSFFSSVIYDIFLPPMESKKRFYEFTA